MAGLFAMIFNILSPRIETDNLFSVSQGSSRVSA